MDVGVDWLWNCFTGKQPDAVDGRIDVRPLKVPAEPGPKRKHRVAGRCAKVMPYPLQCQHACDAPGCAADLQPPKPATDEECCWICLLGTEAGELERPCPCPRYVHRTCLGRWQLESAGRSEESRCRFCSCTLPPLTETLMPPNLRTKTAHVVPCMEVLHDGKVYKIPVRPGPEGMAEFRASVKRLFGMPPSMEFKVSFECAVPTTGEKVTLRGMDCFNAAAACAAISAARRAASRAHGYGGGGHRGSDGVVYRRSNSNGSGSSGSSRSVPTAHWT